MNSNCLLDTTLVNTDQGLKFIKDIKIGDKILSYNFNKNKEEYKQVTNISSYKIGVIYRIVLEDDIIQCTYNEPFYMYTKNIVLGQFINKKDKLFTLSENDQIVTEVTIKRNDPHMVYDLEIEDNYNYFITKNRILVASKQSLVKSKKKEEK